MSVKKKKRNFSSFDLAEAFRELNLNELTEWAIEAPSVEPSAFYHERMRRLAEVFNISSSERAKELLIDALCEEAMLGHTKIRMWKAAPIKADDLIGTADYVVAPNRGYLDNPLLCVVEAKKDDFEQGLAQCLVEMKACQENNEQSGSSISVYGIVTNGEGWKFYCLDTEGIVFQSSLYSVMEVARVLGALRYVFTQCEKNLLQLVKM